MTGNDQPRNRGLRGWRDEFVILVVGSILGAILENLLSPLPRSFLIALAILSIIVWLVIKLWRRLGDTPLYQIRLWGVSLTIGLAIGAMILSSVVNLLPFPPPVPPTPTPQPPCPSLPETLPVLAPITVGNVSDLRELGRMSVSGVVAVTLSGDGQWLAIATRQGVCWYEWKTMRGNFQLFQTPVTAATFSLDGRLLAVGNVDGTMGVWDVLPEGIQVRWRLPVHTAPVTSLAFSPDNHWLASASNDRTIRLREVLRLETFHVWEEHVSSVNDLAFSLDRRLAFGNREGTVRLYDTQSFTVTNSMTHGASVTTLAFDAHGELLASGSKDKTIRLWDADGHEVRRLGGHTGWVLSVAFSPDGRLLVSGSEDCTIRLWEVDTGAQLRTLDGHTAGVDDVTFSPDGSLLISGSGDGTVRLWGVPAE